MYNHLNNHELPEERMAYKGLYPDKGSENAGKMIVSPCQEAYEILQKAHLKSPTKLLNDVLRLWEIESKTLKLKQIDFASLLRDIQHIGKLHKFKR